MAWNITLRERKRESDSLIDKWAKISSRAVRQHRFLVLYSVSEYCAVLVIYLLTPFTWVEVLIASSHYLIDERTNTGNIFAGH
jgi:hypothetical protein